MLSAFDERADALKSIRNFPFEADFVGITLGNHAMVCRGHKTRGWVERMRELARWHKPGPIVVTGTGHWQQPGPTTNRRQPHRMLTNVAGAIRIHQVFRRDLP